MNTKFNPTEPSTHTARWIETYGVIPNLQELEIHEINVKLSLKNQARLDPMDPDMARVYRDAMTAGAIFPALVGYSTPKGTVLVDGNHRLAAAIAAKATHLWVYELAIETDTHMTLNMILSANATLNGKEATFSDRVKHGVRMVAQGMTIKDAARQVSIAATALSANIKADTVKQRARSLGVGHVIEKMHVTHVGDMFPIRDSLDREQFEQLALAATTANIGEFKALVRMIEPMTATDRVTAIAEHIQQHRDAINIKKGSTRRAIDPSHHFVMHAKGVIALDVEAIIAATPPHRLDSVKHLADDLRYVASQIQQAL